MTTNAIDEACPSQFLTLRHARMLHDVGYLPELCECRDGSKQNHRFANQILAIGFVRSGGRHGTK